MSLLGLLNLLEEVPSYRELREELSGQQVVSLTLPEAAKPLVLSALWQDQGVPTLVVCSRPEEARRLHDQLLVYCGDEAPIYHFAETEVLPYERLITDLATSHQRLRTLAALATGATQTPPLVVSSLSGLLQKTLLPQLFDSLSHTLGVGDRLQLEPLLRRWVEMGYSLECAIEVPGTASRRGGILDIYPPGAPMPARIELWGDQIESIRLFDPATQRSQETVERVTIIPAQEVLPHAADGEMVSQQLRNLDFSNCTTTVRDRIEEELSLLISGQRVEEAGFYAGFFNNASLLDYLPNGLTVLNEPSSVEEAAEELEARSWDLKRVKADRGEIPGNFPSSHLPWQQAQQTLHTRPTQLRVSRWGSDTLSRELPFSTPPSYWARWESLVEDARQRLAEGQRLVLCTQHAQRLAEVFREEGVTAQARNDLAEVPPPGSAVLLRLSVLEGWVLPVEGSPLVLLTDSEVFGTAKRRVPRRRSVVPQEALLSELAPGSYVVHTEHGIARFAGSTTVAQDGGQREYLVLEYAQGDKLYVPTEHLDRVAPYVAPGEEAPTLTRLGTQEWERAKERVKRSTREMAEELLSLYAHREVVQGFAVSPDTPWQQELEDSFPYVETADQLEAIREVKKDMEQPRPMDRLVCGDVGYGKTEVALRAAFKAVQDNKQVAILVPTTVLAQQHYVTFSQRLAVFPVTVEVLSRFRTPGEQEVVVKRLKEGSVDVVIGTHRLLQRDVGFKDLGLVVIDEEQRFGVAHKERLKGLRKEVDVLILTATPIPRTLHMSLAGIRDMSTMETPPEERLPIKTYVSEYSEELVQEAILRELDRGGQVFFLHNRVHQSISMADTIRRLVPQASVAIGHGRMPEEELAQVMADFTNGKIDVLVCTTIIESGLDIPGVNTLIINRADRFGLAQLYQLRGRIGRGAHRAYAYLLIPRGRRITQTAQKRLQTILTATELGAGFRIAMKDLEIRGAGNVLGSEQSGHINTVGYDLYSRLLSDAVEELKAQRAGEKLPPPPSQEVEIQMDLGIPAFIPPDYIADLPTRLGVYQRLARIRQPQEVEEVTEELRDRFGVPPPEVHNLLFAVRLKALCRQAQVEAITRTNETVVLQTAEEVGGARPALEKALGTHVRVGQRQLHLRLDRLTIPWSEALLNVVQDLMGFRERLAQMVGRDRTA